MVQLKGFKSRETDKFRRGVEKKTVIIGETFIFWIREEKRLCELVCNIT